LPVTLKAKNPQTGFSGDFVVVRLKVSFNVKTECGKTTPETLYQVPQ